MSSPSWLADSTARALEASLDLRLSRQRLLASNIANAETPNYQPVDLSFEGALTAAIEDGEPVPPGFATSDPGHLDGVMPTEPEAADVVVRPDVTNALDGNGVDLDRELSRFTDNAIHYQTGVESARRRLALLNYVITNMTTG